MLNRRQKLWAAAVSIASLAGTLYYCRNIGKRYSDRVARFQLFKDEALRTGNLKLLYSPLVFFYLFGVRQSYDSAREFYRVLTFFQPKLVGLDLSEQVFNEQYRDRVKEMDFRPRMAEAARSLEEGRDAELVGFGIPASICSCSQPRSSRSRMWVYSEPTFRV